MKKALLALTLFSMVFALNFVVAAPVEKTDGFVCPVLNDNVGDHNPNTFPIADGDYSLIPGGEPKTISIPTHATNGDGSGSPGGSHSSPGDSDYTAIWASA